MRKVFKGWQAAVGITFFVVVWLSICFGSMMALFLGVKWLWMHT